MWRFQLSISLFTLWWSIFVAPTEILSQWLAGVQILANQAVDHLNNRLRKTRGYRTPNQLIAQAFRPAGGEVIALTT